MFGDSSHADPDTYREIVQRFGDGIHVAFIHDVEEIDPERLEGLVLTRRKRARFSRSTRRPRPRRRAKPRCRSAPPRPREGAAGRRALAATPEGAPIPPRVASGRRARRARRAARPDRLRRRTASLEGDPRRIAIRRCRRLRLADLTLQTLVFRAAGDRLRGHDRALHRGERVDLGTVDVRSGSGSSPAGFRARCGGGDAWLEEEFEGSETYRWEEVTCRTRVARPRGAPGPMLRVVDRTMDLLFVVDAASGDLVRVVSSGGEGHARAWGRVRRSRLRGDSLPDRDPDARREFRVRLDLQRDPKSR